MSQKSVDIRQYSKEVLNLTGVDYSHTSLRLTLNHGTIFIDHINHSHIDYSEYLDLTIPEALALYSLLEEFFEK